MFLPLALTHPPSHTERMGSLPPTVLDAPFTVSQEADTHFRNLLRYVADTVPETADLVPVLSRGATVTTWTWRGASALKEYSDEEYCISYHQPHQVANWPRVRMVGTILATHPDTLEKAHGLDLVLTEVTDGEPLSGRVIGRRY